MPKLLSSISPYFQTCECYNFLEQNYIRENNDIQAMGLGLCIDSNVHQFFILKERLDTIIKKKKRKSDSSSYFNQINALSSTELSTMAISLSFKWINVLAVGVFVCCHNEHNCKKMKNPFRTCTLFIWWEKMNIFGFLCWPNLCVSYVTSGHFLLVLHLLYYSLVLSYPMKTVQYKNNANQNSCWHEIFVFFLHQMSWATWVECVGFILLADYLTNGTRQEKNMVNTAKERITYESVPSLRNILRRMISGVKAYSTYNMFWLWLK